MTTPIKPDVADLDAVSQHIGHILADSLAGTRLAARCWFAMLSGAQAFAAGHGLDEIPVMEHPDEREALKTGWQAAQADKVVRQLADALGVIDDDQFRQRFEHVITKVSRWDSWKTDALAEILVGPRPSEADDSRVDALQQQVEALQAELDEVRIEAEVNRRDAACWRAVCEGREGSQGDRSFSDNPYDDNDLHAAWSFGWHGALYHRETLRVMQVRQEGQVVAQQLSAQVKQLQSELGSLRDGHEHWTAVKDGYVAAEYGFDQSANPHQGLINERGLAWAYGWQAFAYHREQRARQQAEARWNTFLDGRRSIQFPDLPVTQPTEPAFQEAWEYGRLSAVVYPMIESAESIQHGLGWQLDLFRRHIDQLLSEAAVGSEELARLRRVEQLYLAEQAGSSAAERGQSLSANPEPSDDAERYSAWQRGWRLVYLMGRLAALRKAIAWLPEWRRIYEAHAQQLNPDLAVHATGHLSIFERQIREASDLSHDALVARFAEVWERLHPEGI